MKTTPKYNHTRRGLTLVEVAVSSFLIGMLTIAALKSVGGAMTNWNSVTIRYNESLLAEQLLNEIVQASYTDPNGSPAFGIESNEPASPADRSAFDDIDDYDNWTESPPKYKNGTAIQGLSGWSLAVDVKKLNSSNPGSELSDSASDQSIRKIEVTVTNPRGDQKSVYSWRINSGSPERPKGVDSSFVTWIGCELQIGSSGDIASTGVDVLNHATLQTP